MKFSFVLCYFFADLYKYLSPLVYINSNQQEGGINEWMSVQNPYALNDNRQVQCYELVNQRH